MLAKTNYGLGRGTVEVLKDRGPAPAIRLWVKWSKVQMKTEMMIMDTAEAQQLAQDILRALAPVNPSVPVGMNLGPQPDPVQEHLVSSALELEEQEPCN